jgi:hypothetical protein
MSLSLSCPNYYPPPPPSHFSSPTHSLSEGLQKHFKDIKFLLCIFEIPDSFVEKLSCAAKRNLLEWHFYGCNYFSCCCILYGGFCELTFEKFSSVFFSGGGRESSKVFNRLSGFKHSFHKIPKDFFFA